MSADKEKPFNLKDGATSSDEVSTYYDDWAGTYNETLKSWDYTAPVDTAELLVPHINPGDRVLDIGCGTGLFGAAMATYDGFKMTGIDISEDSLKIAGQNDLYDRLIQHDLQQVPLPVEENSMAGAACVGVLTYIEDAEALLRDACRCVRSGGVIAFTQRTDRWEQLGFRELVDKIARDRLWSVLGISEPKPYLPANPDFGDEIKVIHTACRVN